MNTRPYRSKTRALQAQATKKRILDAARELFASEGFDKTTIASVAERAGVSSASIYAGFKSKEGLVSALVRAAVFGDDYQALVARALSKRDVVESLKMTASIARYVCETEEAEMRGLQGAIFVSPALKQLKQEAEQLRYDCQDELVARLFREGVVRPELTVQEVNDILWSLTSRELYTLMVGARGWSPEAYEAWLADTLVRVLLKQGGVANAFT